MSESQGEVLFALPSAPANLASTSSVEVIDCISCVPFQYNFLPSGPSFEHLLLKLKGEIKDEDVGNESSEEEQEDEKGSSQTTAEEDSLREKTKNKHKEHSILGQVQDDMYELLGLDSLKFRATQDDIKTAYRKMILKYHPDKNQNVSDDVFKSIQKAYDTLSDPKKRRAYDSQLPFDESIPSESTVAKGNFYEVFGPVFERYSRWSGTQPCPLLGDDNTPYNEVGRIYRFWMNFNSWRDFSFNDEYDLEQADSREERRWMENQNKKERQKLKQAEVAKISKFVDLAHKYDPRILRREQEIEREKDAKRIAKEEAQKRKLEEQERIKKEEEERKQREERERKAEEKRKKQEKEKELKELDNIKDRVRAALYVIKPKPPIEDVERVVAHFNTAQQIEFAAQIEALQTNEEKRTLYKSILETIDKIMGEKSAEQRRLKEEAEKKYSPKGETPWTDEELSQLARAVAKYPGGANSRWESIQKEVPTRTVKEIIVRVKSAKTFSKPSLAKDPMEKLKQKVGDKPIVSPPSARDDYESTTSSSESTTSSPTTPSTSSPSASASESSEWTGDQQKLLEKGLQQFPASLEDRWEQISKLVGRSKKDCVIRYKYLVNLYKKK